MPSQQVVQLLQAAIEASVYIAPTEPGLTLTELFEIGNRIGLKDGEISDAMPQVATQYFGQPNRRLLLPEHLWHLSGFLIFREEPDLRSVEAFDFVVSQLNDLTRDVGSGKAQLDRSIIVERAVAAGIPRHDAEVAITLMVLSGQVIEENTVLRFKFAPGGQRQLPSASLNQPGGHPPDPKHARNRVMPHVRDVIERRTDRRPQSAEPFGAFAEQLQNLGYGQFRLWWNQTVAELARTNPNSSPLSALVLAAALVEGALTFIVTHARRFDLGVFGSKDFERDSTKWRIDDLVAGAARGGDAAVFDFQTKNRAEGLIRTRQRIHAGRMLVEFPQGVPDLRPEEAREAKAVAQQVVRSVLDWLAKYPPPTN
jgi:hypothetical protein